MSAKLLLGPILLGTILNTTLYGVCATQYATYYMSKRRLEDSRTTRYLVTWELAVDTFHSATSVYLVWLYMVENYLNAPFLQSAPWPISAVPLITAMSAYPIQTFLSWRVFKLSRSPYVFALLISLTIASTAMAITSSSLAFAVQRFDDGSRLRPVVDGWLAVTMVTDLAITGFLVYYLNQGRSAIFARTDNVLNRLIRSAIESAAFATFFSIMVLIMFTRSPTTGFHLLFSLPMGRTYTSTLLSTLNQRESLSHDLSGTCDLGDLSFTLSTTTNINFRETKRNTLHQTSTRDGCNVD
ncbi:hypothetical protein FB451DRAFT_691233 [Mycena latifolia]|nr:hypothetical protein FB451DRAFT_691233 [Mycena latifolia]